MGAGENFLVLPLSTSRGSSNALGTRTWLLMLTGPEIILGSVPVKGTLLLLAGLLGLGVSVSVVIWGSLGDAETRPTLGPGCVQQPCLPQCSSMVSNVP